MQYYADLSMQLQVFYSDDKHTYTGVCGFKTSGAATLIVTGLPSMVLFCSLSTARGGLCKCTVGRMPIPENFG